MSKTKFTPGPWWPVFTGDIRRAVRSESGFIGTLPKPNHYTGQDERYDEELIEAKANADLIAAAPEMYYLLAGILEDWQNRLSVEFSAAVIHNNSNGVGIHFDYAQMPSVPEWVNKAKEVLAKARGEAQPEQEEDHPSDGDRLLDELHANAPTPYDP